MIGMIEKGLRTWELIDLDEFIKNYMESEKYADFEYRTNILTYEVAELTKSIIYKRYYGYYEIDLMVKLSDILFTTLCLATISGIKFQDILNIGIQRYHDKVYKVK